MLKFKLVSGLALISILAGCSGNTAPSSAGSSQSAQDSGTLSTAGVSPKITQSSSPNAGEKPVAPETNPVGDFPGSQVFVKYTSQASGYSLAVPEGWARKDTLTEVSFIDKLDGIKVTTEHLSSPPTLESIRATQIIALQKTGKAIQIIQTRHVKLPGDDAILVTYTSNSDPDPVTEKRVRLENERFFFYQNNKLVTLTLWAPLGADNVDQWKKISESFQWSGK